MRRYLDATGLLMPDIRQERVFLWHQGIYYGWVDISLTEENEHVYYLNIPLVSPTTVIFPIGWPALYTIPLPIVYAPEVKNQFEHLYLYPARTST